MTGRSVAEIAEAAKEASLVLAGLSADIKNAVLENMAEGLEANCASILAANAEDLAFAKEENLPGPLVSRLALDEAKVRQMAEGIRSVIRLADPVAQVESGMELDEGLVLTRVSCPIGVIGAIFESRPDAVPQISSLCLKSGNAVILKGGREAQNSNKVIVDILRQALEKSPEAPPTAVQLIETRSEVVEMLQQDASINLIVPRGSNDFVRYVQEHTKIPVLGHSEGICHVYIDAGADRQKAVDIALDSKLQYPAACNAMETLLVNREVAGDILPDLANQLRAQNVQLSGCEETRHIVPDMDVAGEGEWDTEYNDLKLSVKLVRDCAEAIAHINAHGSGHTDTIVTEDRDRAEKFLNEVDSASVMWNASTRFADGFRYGLGAEIGISTNKTHARGPVGLEGLVIYKYKLVGDGQTVAEYSGENGKKFTHRSLS